MAQFRRQSLTAYGAPLCETVAEVPEPAGAEVLVRVAKCGVCHSDLHMQDGYFDLGQGRKLELAGGRALPFTLGHEIAGTVERAGPDASARVGDAVAVYPWIGCGKCRLCQAGEELLCDQPRQLGITVDGGYATHVLVPDAKYLLAYDPLPAAFAAAAMCSGLTAFSALKKVQAQAARGPVLILGLGGVGMMAVAFARALLPQPPLVADLDAGKREAALAAGAAHAFDPADAGSRKEILKLCGGAAAVCDFVGSDKSLAYAMGAVAKGGKIVVAGLLGGAHTIPVPMFPLKVMTIEGTFVGTLAEAKEMLAIMREGRVPSIPMTERPLEEAQSALDDLRNGRVTGRVVLTPT